MRGRRATTRHRDRASPLPWARVYERSSTRQGAGGVRSGQEGQAAARLRPTSGAATTAPRTSRGDPLTSNIDAKPEPPDAKDVRERIELLKKRVADDAAVGRGQPEDRRHGRSSRRRSHGRGRRPAGQEARRRQLPSRAEEAPSSSRRRASARRAAARAASSVREQKPVLGGRRSRRCRGAGGRRSASGSPVSARATRSSTSRRTTCLTTRWNDWGQAFQAEAASIAAGGAAVAGGVLVFPQTAGGEAPVSAGLRLHPDRAVVLGRRSRRGSDARAPRRRRALHRLAVGWQHPRRPGNGQLPCSTGRQMPSGFRLRRAPAHLLARGRDPAARLRRRHLRLPERRRLRPPPRAARTATRAATPASPASPILRPCAAGRVCNAGSLLRARCSPPTAAPTAAASAIPPAGAAWSASTAGRAARAACAPIMLRRRLLGEPRLQTAARARWTPARASPARRRRSAAPPPGRAAIPRRTPACRVSPPRITTQAPRLPGEECRRLELRSVASRTTTCHAASNLAQRRRRTPRRQLAPRRRPRSAMARSLPTSARPPDSINPRWP